MQSIYYIIPIYFFATLSLFIISYLIGSFILKNIRLTQEESVYSNLFFNTIIGALVLVVIVSIYQTGFITVNLLFIIILLFFYIEKQYVSPIKINLSIQKRGVCKFDIKSSLLVLLILFVCFAWQSAVTLNYSSFPVNNIERDNFYYAEISKCLINTGYENTFTNANLINETYHFPTPYHYFDLWINGIISKLYGLNYTLSLYLVTYAFFSALFVIGLLSVFEILKINFKYRILISVLLLFVSGMHFTDELLHLNQYSSQMEGLNEKYGGKLLGASCFILLFFILYLTDNFRFAYLVLLCLPIISISLAPAIYGGMMIFAAVQFINKKEERSFYLRYFIYALTSAVLMSLFYYVFQNGDLNYRFNKPLFEYSDLKEFSFFNLKFYVVELILKMYAQPFLFIINYFPFLLTLIYLMLIKKIDKNIKSVLVLFFIIWLTGLVAFSTFYLIDDANQFYTNSLILWHVLFAVMLIKCIGVQQEGNHLSGKIILVLFVLGTLFNFYYSFFSHKKASQKLFSHEYLISINKYSAKYKTETKGAILNDVGFYDNLKISYPLEFYSVPFIFSQNVLVPFNLTNSAAVDQNNKYQIEKHLLNNPFSLYLNQNTNQNTSENSLNFQIGFIKRYGIKYILSHQHDSINLNEYFEIDTVFTDKLSGQKFVALK